MIVEARVQKNSDGLAQLTLNYDDGTIISKSNCNVLTTFRMLRSEGLVLVDKDITGLSVWERVSN